MHCVLGRTRLHFAKRTGNRQVRDHDEHHVVRMTNLEDTCRLDEHDVLIIPHRAADLDDGDIGFVDLGGMFKPANDLVTDMRDGFNALATIAERPLLLDHMTIDHAARDVVITRQIPIQETFVVAHVLIGFKTRIQNKNLTVFGGVHGAGINIEVGVDFGEIDLESLGGEDGTE